MTNAIQPFHLLVIALAGESPRLEPRSRWRRTARCAFPQAPVAGQCGARIRLDVRYYRGRKHLPVVALMRAA